MDLFLLTDDCLSQLALLCLDIDKEQKLGKEGKPPSFFYIETSTTSMYFWLPLKKTYYVPLLTPV
jgi:hypothetical protein